MSYKCRFTYTFGLGGLEKSPIRHKTEVLDFHKLRKTEAAPPQIGVKKESIPILRPGQLRCEIIGGLDGGYKQKRP